MRRAARGPSRRIARGSVPLNSISEFDRKCWTNRLDNVFHLLSDFEIGVKRRARLLQRICTSRGRLNHVKISFVLRQKIVQAPLRMGGAVPVEIRASKLIGILYNSSDFEGIRGRPDIT